MADGTAPSRQRASERIAALLGLPGPPLSGEQRRAYREKMDRSDAEHAERLARRTSPAA